MYSLMRTIQLSRPRLNALVLAAALIAAGLTVFGPGLNGWFVFDDHVNLVMSEAWKVTALDMRDWQRALFSDISGAAGRPLAMGSFAVNHYLTGLDPFWLKAGNLALHLLNAMLIWRLCSLLFERLPASTRPGMHTAWLLALAWAVHPLQVSTVMYIVQRMEIGATTAILLALLAYVKGRSRQMDGRTGWPWLAAVPLATLFGLGFKESALLAPGFALLIELTLLRFDCRDPATSRYWKKAWCAVAIFGLAAYLAVITPVVTHWPYDIRSFGPSERLLTQLPVLVMYIQQIMLPLPDSMRFYYDNYPVSAGLLQPARTAGAACILLLVATAAAIAHRRYPLVTLGIGWFFMGHALTSNLWPLELAFEHRNYLALLGLLIALVQPAQHLLRRLHADARIVIAALPVLLLLALCSLQARTWGDPMQLAWTLENRSPDSPRANYDLASQLLMAAKDDPSSPFWSMALKQFEHGALGSNPSPLSLQGLLLMHGRAGVEPPARYWDLLRESLTAKELHGERAGTLHALTACQIQSRCALSSAQMLNTFIAVVQRNPDSPTAHTLYANFAWNVLDDQALATRLQREAVRLQPSDPAYRLALAKFLLASKNMESIVEGRELLPQLHKDNRSGQLDREVAELDQLVRNAAQPNAGTQ